MAVDINLLKSLIGDTNPLYNIYEEEGLFDEGNILPYEADTVWEKDLEGLKKWKDEARGYTRSGDISPMYSEYDRETGIGTLAPPEYDTRLFIRDLEKFKTPEAPLYNAPGMTSGLDENITDFPQNRFEGRAVGVDKFGKIQYAPMSKLEAALEDYGPNPGTYSPTGLWEGRSYNPIWDAPTITEKNKEIAGVIGHEAGHQLLGRNPEFFRSINPTYVVNEEGEEGDFAGREELLTRMLDFQAKRSSNIYNNIYEQIHGKKYIQSMPRHLYSPIADKYSDQATAFTDYILAKSKEKIAARKNVPGTPIVPMDRGRGRDNTPGSMPTGTAGRNPWGRADGGLATMFQRR